MPYSNEQLAQRVAALTERLNLIEQTAKKTEELPQQDPLDENSLLRVGQEHISIEQILDKQNNLGNVRIVFIDWTQDEQTQLIAHINNNGLVVGKDEIWFLQTFKVYASGQLVKYYHKWMAGAGSWGTVNGNTIYTPKWFLLSTISTSESEATRYDLGEIGTTPIEDVVKTSGPYQVSPSSSYLFLTERSGEPNVYLYAGSVNGLIGINEAQPTADDFINITEQPTFEESLYDHAISGYSTDINNFSSLTEKFYLLEIVDGTNPPIHYFASKQTNIEDFVDSRIYIQTNGTKHYLGAPNLSQYGYYFWDLGNLANMPPGISGPPKEAFQAWFHVAEITETQKAVLYVPQSLSTAQKQQAQTNIGVDNFPDPLQAYQNALT